ncbi:hypothetical protein [Litoreibacter roseus]|uniref:Uncharacterized protein n=1 Tax=Litoreibacter roseus TaxID=2601869 RepID=A0A6N6JIT6_9RHOB|nr:hypothetical protein [Litoreibacter roseus]GFE66241.1 hypothetical protein KIN_33150 [Litoreibacter roseus]
MKHTLLTLLIGVSIAMSPVAAAPARADNDVAKIAAGLATLFILGKALEGRDDDRKNKTKKAKRHTKRYDDRHFRHDSDDDDDRYRKRDHRSSKHRRKIAPRRCLREQWTRRSWRDVYGARCLEDRARVRPPRDCLRRSQTDSGPRRFYTQRCLRRNGWTL